MLLSHQCEPHPWLVPSCRHLESDDGVTPNSAGAFNAWLNTGSGLPHILCPNTDDPTLGYLFIERLYASGRHTIRGVQTDASRLLFDGTINGACLDFWAPGGLRLSGLSICQVSGTATHMLKIGTPGSSGGDAPDVRLDDVRVTTNPLTSNGRPSSDNGGISGGVTESVVELIGWHQGKISRSTFTNYSNIAGSATLTFDGCDQVSIVESEVHGFVRSGDTVKLKNGGGHISFRDGLISNSSPKGYNPVTQAWDWNYPQGRSHLAVYGDYGPVVFDNAKLYSESGNAPQSVVWQDSGKITGWRFSTTAVQATWAVFHGNPGTRIRGLVYGPTEYMATPTHLIYKSGTATSGALTDSEIWAGSMSMLPGGSYSNVRVY
jgi:hypothetical protein